MELTILSVDHAPAELHAQLPLVLDLTRMVPGDDRPDYWIGTLRIPVAWRVGNRDREVTHVVLAARWEGTSIAQDVSYLPVALAYVTDPSLLDDARLDFEKCRYVAVGLASATGGGRPPEPLRGILAGTIARAFGTGRRS